MEIKRLYRPEKLVNPPDDPTSPYYLTYCYVCTEEAKPNLEHIRNYGAIVCFSCRAFWRRTHQKSREPTYTCKTNGSCVLTMKNRRSCQKCRFDRCQAAGMLAEAVLSEKQKEIRFQKYIQKKSRQSAVVAESGQQDHEPHPPQEREQQPLRRVRRKRHLVTSAEEENHFPILTTNEDNQPYQESSRLMPNTMSESSIKLRRKLDPKVNEISTSFQESVKYSPQDFAELLEGNVNKKEILNHFVKISDEFQTFALSLRQFSRLGKRDQQLLLGRNTPLYIQLYIGLTFLGEQTYFSKMSRFFEDATTKKYLATLAKSFRQGCDMSLYKELIAKLLPLQRLKSNEQQAILAYVVLFDISDTLNVNQFEALEDIEMLNAIMFETYIQSEGFEHSLEDLTSILETMAVFFAHNTDWNGTSMENEIEDMPAHMSLNVVMPYTAEEESWLKRQLEMVEQEFLSIPMGEDNVYEFMMYSLGVPLSKKYMPSIFSILNERLVKIFKMHSEFEELPLRSQLKVLKDNCFTGLSVMVVKAEHCSTGLEQMQMGFGKDEEEKWRNYYSPVFDTPAKIKKMSMTNNAVITEEQAGRFASLISEANDFINEPILYKLNLMLALFQPSPSGEDNVLANVYSKYVTILRRRLDWMKKRTKIQGSNFTQYHSTSEVVAKMKYNVKILNQVAMMLASVGQPP